MWFQRAEKVSRQLDYMQYLLDFLSYAAMVSNRFVHEYIPQLKNEKDKSKRLRKNEIVKEMRGLIELYSAYQLDYDCFDHKTQPQFALFVVRFPP